MKISNLSQNSHDIHENKDSCALGQAVGKQTMGEKMRKEGGPVSRESKPGLPNGQPDGMNTPGGPEKLGCRDARGDPFSRQA